MAHKYKIGDKFKLNDNDKNYIVITNILVDDMDGDDYLCDEEADENGCIVSYFGCTEEWLESCVKLQNARI